MSMAPASPTSALILDLAVPIIDSGDVNEARQVCNLNLEIDQFSDSEASFPNSSSSGSSVSSRFPRFNGCSYFLVRNIPHFLALLLRHGNTKTRPEFVEQSFDYNIRVLYVDQPVGAASGFSQELEIPSANNEEDIATQQDFSSTLRVRNPL
jgi:hypothetical protein